MRSYIEINGLSTEDEVFGSLMCCGRLGITSKGKKNIALGMMHHLDIKREQRSTMREREPYPRTEIAQQLFARVKDPDILRIVHCEANSDAELGRKLLALNSEMLGVNCFQIHLCWPRPNELEWVKAKTGKFLILHIGAEAFATFAEEPSILQTKLDQYTGFIDGLVFDPTPWQIQELDLYYIAALLAEVKGLNTRISVGVAGDFFNTPLIALENFKQEHPYFSISADACLRDENNRMRADAVEEYLRLTNELFPEAIMRARRPRGGRGRTRRS